MVYIPAEGIRWLGKQFQPLCNRRMLICVFTGFSSGLPLYLLINLVPAWLKSEGVDLALIGLFSIIQFPYTWKFLWSPLMDRWSVLGMGRRRGWMLLSQLLLMGGIALLGSLVPSDGPSLQLIALLAGAVALFSASQDIVLDAYRREILADDELGLGTAVHVNAYRIAGLVPGALSLILADHLPWPLVFMLTSLFMLPGIALTLLVTEPQLARVPQTLRQAVVEPFHEFISRQGWRNALYILGFIFLYKLGDSMATALATPFYLDLGYSKTMIGLVAKNAGLWPCVIGALLGGLWMVRLGINRALWLFGVVQLLTILGFAWLATVPPSPWSLGLVIGAEALGVGLGTAAFTAFIARTTDPRYTATQFALFTSLAAVPRTFFNASTGYLAESLGWVPFFLLCTLLAVPGMLLLFKVAPWQTAPGSEDSPS